MKRHCEPSNAIRLLAVAISWQCTFRLGSIFCGLMGLNLLSGTAIARNTDQSPPNVLFIIADDLGIGDLGCYGNTVVDTPVIDSLAASGIRFTQHYAPSPLCAPSRAGFLTGLFNHRTGAVDVPSNRGLDRIALSHKTFGNYFQNAGYWTALIGKWHNGLYCREYLPDRRGFDTFFGFANGGQDYYQWNLLRNNAQQPSQAVPFDGRYLTNVLNKEASQFVSTANQNNQRFALFLAHHVPHVPLQAPERLINKYRQKLNLADALDTNSADKKRAVSSGQNVAIIYAMIEAMDTGLGRVFQTLKDNGQWDNTVIVFTSDNGAWLGRYNGQTTQRFHAGLKGNKGDVGEQGIRVPAIVSWPGKIKGGRVIHTPIHGCDWLPTLLSLTDAQRRPDQAQRRSDDSGLVELNRSKQTAQRSTFPHGQRHASLPLFASVEPDSALDRINLRQQSRPDQVQHHSGNSRLVELNRSKQTAQRSTLSHDQRDSLLPLFTSVEPDSALDGINLRQQSRPDQVQHHSGNSRLVELNRSKQTAQRSTLSHDQRHSSLPSFASVETNPAFDGINLMPLLMGRGMPELDERQLPFQKNRYRPAAHSDAAIREGRWKLVWPGVPVTMKKDSDRDNPSYKKGLVQPHWEMPLDTQLDPVPRFQDPTPELYDLVNDPAERIDVASDHADLVKRLSASYDAWFADVMNDWQKSRQAIMDHDKAWWQRRGTKQ